MGERAWAAEEVLGTPPPPAENCSRGSKTPGRGHSREGRRGGGGEGEGKELEVNFWHSRIDSATN